MRQLINHGWEFLKAEPGSRYEEVVCREREAFCLPHDWAIGDVADFYRDADGWYFLKLDASLIPEEHTEVLLRFDGVYMDSRVYLNGQPAAEHHYGYTAFYVRLSGLCGPGSMKWLCRCATGIRIHAGIQVRASSAMWSC